MGQVNQLDQTVDSSLVVFYQWTEWTLNQNNNNNTHLMAIFQDNRGNPVSECHNSGFYWSKDDVDGGDNYSYSMYKAPVELYHHN